MTSAPQSPDSSRLEPPDEAHPEPVGRLAWPAQLYLAAVIGSAVALAAAVAPRGHLDADWPTFASLTAAAALAQLFAVLKPGNQRLKPTIVFILPAAILFPIQVIPLFTVAQYLPEWLRARTKLRVASFNMAKGVLDTSAAWATYDLLGRTHALPLPGNVTFALASLTTCVVYVAVNHSLVAMIIRLTTQPSFRETGLFSLEPLTTDLIIAGLGVGVATTVVHNGWVVPFLVAPLVLIQRSLAIPQLQAEARIDPKTGLYNIRHFLKTLSQELDRSRRLDRPFSLIMADLDLLRDINNNYGHLAGDVVLQGIAEIFRRELRHYDVPARFGGEEFSILLPETRPDEALRIADRVRRVVAAHEFEVDTVAEPIHATISMGIAGFPQDGGEASELIHQADLAVYRAKLQGRNRVCGTSREPLLLPPERTAKLVVVEPQDPPTPLQPAPQIRVDRDANRRRPRSHATHGPRLLAVSPLLGSVVVLVSTLGVGAAVAGLIWGHSTSLSGLVAMVVLVGGVQALSLELADVDGTISVSAVGSLAGAALFDYRAALPLSLAIAAVEWSAHRPSLRHSLYNIGTLSLSSLAAAAIFRLGVDGGAYRDAIVAGLGLFAGAAYFGVNMSLVAVASGLEGRENPWGIFRERFAWLLPHYVVYGFIGSVIALAYDAVGPYALAVFVVPLLLMRKTQASYLAHTQRSAQSLREAAETIQSQNVSLEQANRLLRERTTAAMESLSATVDARDAYTAGHSRRVQELSLALGRQLGLSQAELDLLEHAALFHDIGKLAIPDAILLKPGSLTPAELGLMRRHATEGARIIERLGFLQDAVPAIRHHHEHFDGSGYPDGLVGEEIPLGARIIHVADAIDSMLTDRVYRAARPLADALAEVRRLSGTQFCPRCVAALDRIAVADVFSDGTAAPRPVELVRAASE